MWELFYLTKRNMLLYFRERGAVLMSMLSMLIIIMLMFIFLGDTNVDAVTELLAVLPGHDTSNDEKNAELLCTAWTIGGIIPINAVMVTLTTLSSIIKDKTSGKINSICTSPVSRFVISFSYILAACISSVMICLITAAVSEIYLCVKGMQAFTLAEHMKLFGMILVNSFAYSAVMYPAAILVKSEGAWSGLGMIVGTLVGFLGGIYLPVGQLSQGVANVLSCTPVIYSTAMFRDVMTRTAADITFADAPIEMAERYKNIIGISLEAFGNSISAGQCVIIVTAAGIFFSLLGTALTTMIKRKDK